VLLQEVLCQLDVIANADDFAFGNEQRILEIKSPGRGRGFSFTEYPKRISNSQRLERPS